MDPGPCRLLAQGWGNVPRNVLSGHLAAHEDAAVSLTDTAPACTPAVFDWEWGGGDGAGRWRVENAVDGRAEAGWWAGARRGLCMERPVRERAIELRRESDPGVQRLESSLLGSRTSTGPGLDLPACVKGQWDLGRVGV